MNGIVVLLGINRYLHVLDHCHKRLNRNLYHSLIYNYPGINIHVVNGDCDKCDGPCGQNRGHNVLCGYLFYRKSENYDSNHDGIVCTGAVTGRIVNAAARIETKAV